MSRATDRAQFAEDEFNDWEGQEETLPNACPQCEGLGETLGALGGTAHYRCRHCGWLWSKEIEK